MNTEIAMQTRPSPLPPILALTIALGLACAGQAPDSTPAASSAPVSSPSPPIPDPVADIEERIVTLKELGDQAREADDDQLAVEYYEKALALKDKGHSPDLLIAYANTLTDVDRLPDSLEAYERARLAGASEALVDYNLACAHSRLENGEEAYYHLSRSLLEGWSKPELVLKDSDLEHLRAQPWWETRWKLLQNHDEALQPERLAGDYIHSGPSWSPSLTLCPDGNYAQETLPDDGSCCSAVERGTWEVTSEGLELRPEELCEESGAGEAFSSTIGCFSWERCRPIACGPTKRPSRVEVSADWLPYAALQAAPPDYYRLVWAKAPTLETCVRGGFPPAEWYNFGIK